MKRLIINLLYVIFIGGVVCVNINLSNQRKKAYNIVCSPEGYGVRDRNGKMWDFSPVWSTYDQAMDYRERSKFRDEHPQQDVWPKINWKDCE